MEPPPPLRLRLIGSGRVCFFNKSGNSIGWNILGQIWAPDRGGVRGGGTLNELTFKKTLIDSGFEFGVGWLEGILEIHDNFSHLLSGACPSFF